MFYDEMSRLERETYRNDGQPDSGYVCTEAAGRADRHRPGYFRERRSDPVLRAAENAQRRKRWALRRRTA